MKKIFLTGTWLIAITCMSGVVAQTTSSIRYEQGQDNIDGESRYLDIDLGLQSKHHIVFGAGNSTSVVENETLDSESYYLGILTNPNADLATGLTYTALNEEKSYELDSIRLDLIANTENWGFSLLPELRSIDFFTITSTTPTVPGPGSGTTTTSESTINTISPGLGFVASYYGIDRVYIRAGYTVYGYEKPVTASSSQTLASVSKISVSTLDQDYGLEDSRGIFAAGYNYGAGYVGVRHTRSVSAVSDITTITNSVYISYRFSEAWRTELSTGSVDDGITESRFVSAALGYYW
jgi:hypothetical protein